MTELRTGPSFTIILHFKDLLSLRSDIFIEVLKGNVFFVMQG